MVGKDPFDCLFLTFESGEVLVDHVDDGLPVDLRDIAGKQSTRIKYQSGCLLVRR